MMQIKEVKKRNNHKLDLSTNRFFIMVLRITQHHMVIRCKMGTVAEAVSCKLYQFKIARFLSNTYRLCSPPVRRCGGVAEKQSLEFSAAGDPTQHFFLHNVFKQIILSIKSGLRRRAPPNVFSHRRHAAAPEAGRERLL